MSSWDFLFKVSSGRIACSSKKNVFKNFTVHSEKKYFNILLLKFFLNSQKTKKNKYGSTLIPTGFYFRYSNFFGLNYEILTKTNKEQNIKITTTQKSTPAKYKSYNYNLNKWMVGCSKNKEVCHFYGFDRSRNRMTEKSIRK